MNNLHRVSDTFQSISHEKSATLTHEAVREQDRSNLLVPRQLWRFFLASAGALTPCLWHYRLAAGDLGSHIYNAWLVQQIERGQLTDLWIAQQWNNVLFDYLLSALGGVLSLHVAARIAVSICVLVFFWGSFAFIQAATRRPPWFIVPVLTAFAYGWTFQQGLFNYYLSLGLAFFGLAFFWSVKGRKRFLGVVLAPVVLLAHPLGFAWLVGGALYISAAELVPRRLHYLLVLAAIFVLGGAHQFLWRHFRVEGPTHSVLFYNGVDQIIFTKRYLYLAFVFGVLLATAVAFDIVRRRDDKNHLAVFAIPFELYLVAEAAVLLLPDAIWWPQYAAPTSLITERFTLISGVLLLCLWAAVKPRGWHRVANTAIPLIFLAFLYQDTSRINHMQEQAVRLVHEAPPGQRILVSIANPLKYRFGTKHIIDEACLGYCFLYGNYEAPSLQFRVRARPGNRYVMTSIEQAAAMERGQYIIQSEDLPASQIYQCGPTWMDLCIHPLQAGERNDSLGFHPELGIYPDADRVK